MLFRSAQIGIGVGVASFVIVAAAIAWLLYRSRKSGGGKDGQSTLHADVSQEEKQQLSVHAHELWSSHGYGELGQREEAELAAHNVPQELEAKSRNI